MKSKHQNTSSEACIRGIMIVSKTDSARISYERGDFCTKLSAAVTVHLSNFLIDVRVAEKKDER
jgi:hypothetical protein